MVVTYTLAKDRCQIVKGHSVQMEWEQTDRQTDGTSCITFLANAVGLYSVSQEILSAPEFSKNFPKRLRILIKSFIHIIRSLKYNYL